MCGAEGQIDPVLPEIGLTLLVIAGGGHHPLAITFGSHFNLDGANWL